VVVVVVVVGVCVLFICFVAIRETLGEDANGGGQCQVWRGPCS
jgi:hypothetical protein